VGNAAAEEFTIFATGFRDFPGHGPLDVVADPARRASYSHQQRAHLGAKARHWIAEAMAIVSQPVHWHIVRLSRMPEFQPDCRWIAGQIGVGVDDVNLAFTRLLRLRLLEVRTPSQWRDLMRVRKMTEREFRRLALSRIREKAAEPGPCKQFVVRS
jgi:hypothetical protein